MGISRVLVRLEESEISSLSGQDHHVRRERERARGASAGVVKQRYVHWQVHVIAFG